MYISSELDSRSPVVQRVLRIRERLNQVPFAHTRTIDAATSLLQESSQHTAKHLGSREETQLSWTKIDSDDDVDMMHDCTALP